MNFLALDIGSFYLKIADGKGFAETSYFPLRQRASALAQELRTRIAQAPPCDHLAVTMTGELVDRFPSKGDGVTFILDAVAEAADGRHTRVYCTDGKMVTPTIAKRAPLVAATSTWHVLARFATRFVPEGSGLLLDVGSTTCDVIPLVDGEIAADGKTNTERLLRGELVYTGVERSPLCAVTPAVPFRGESCPVAQALFALTHDVYVILGNFPEEPTNVATPDGRNITKASARTRLGRSICADGEEFNHRDAVAIAQAVEKAQVAKIISGVQQVLANMPTPPTKVVLSGHGEFLGRRVVEELELSHHIISLAREASPSISRCAAAHALAVLAREAMEQ